MADRAKGWPILRLDVEGSHAMCIRVGRPLPEVNMAALLLAGPGFTLRMAEANIGL